MNSIFVLAACCIAISVLKLVDNLSVFPLTTFHSAPVCCVFFQYMSVCSFMLSKCKFSHWVARQRYCQVPSSSVPFNDEHWPQHICRTCYSLLVFLLLFNELALVGTCYQELTRYTRSNRYRYSLPWEKGYSSRVWCFGAKLGCFKVTHHSSLIALSGDSQYSLLLKRNQLPPCMLQMGEKSSS